MLTTLLCCCGFNSTWSTSNPKNDDRLIMSDIDRRIKDNAQHDITFRKESTENLTGIKPGLQYIERHSLGFYGTSVLYGYEIGDLVEVSGKEAYEVWILQPHKKKKVGVYTYLHIDGLRVYMLGVKGSEYEGKWLQLYDFGLQPGEIMVGYSYIHIKPSKFFYKCVDIRGDEEYNELKIMTLWAKESIVSQYGADEATWIQNYGGTHGLLCPSFGSIAGIGGYELMEIRDGDNKIFSLFDIKRKMPWEKYHPEPTRDF